MRIHQSKPPTRRPQTDRRPTCSALRQIRRLAQSLALVAPLGLIVTTPSAANLGRTEPNGVVGLSAEGTTAAARAKPQDERNKKCPQLNDQLEKAKHQLEEYEDEQQTDEEQLTKREDELKLNTEELELFHSIKPTSKKEAAEVARAIKLAEARANNLLAHKHTLEVKISVDKDRVNAWLDKVNNLIDEVADKHCA